MKTMITKENDANHSINYSLQSACRTDSRYAESAASKQLNDSHDDDWELQYTDDSDDDTLQ